MAQKVSILLVDDLDGSEATETVSFGLDGVQYEIDLNDGNADDLRAALQPFAAAGRRVGGKRKASARAPRATASKEDRPKLTLVREWARENGHEVSDRGRIPERVMEAYTSAIS